MSKASTKRKPKRPGSIAAPTEWPERGPWRQWCELLGMPAVAFDALAEHAIPGASLHPRTAGELRERYRVVMAALPPDRIGDLYALLFAAVHVGARGFYMDGPAAVQQARLAATAKMNADKRSEITPRVCAYIRRLMGEGWKKRMACEHAKRHFRLNVSVATLERRA